MAYTALSKNDLMLEASNLKIHFPVRRKSLFEKRQFVHAVDDIDLKILNGSAFGIVITDTPKQIDRKAARFWKVLAETV